MTRAARAALSLLALMAGAYACGVSDPCVVPGVAQACSCSDGRSGARACLPGLRWGSCDCSGKIPLPGPVTPAAPSTGGTMAAGTGQGGVGGSGGSTPVGGTGGSAGTMSTNMDSGMPMMGDAGPDAQTDSGPPVVRDAEVDSGPPEPLDPYRACQSDGDCDPNALCVQTPSVPEPYTVCANPCTTASDCPVPEGSYEARVSCLLNYCGLDCTPILFAPLLTCPEGMTCLTDPFGNSLCHADVQ